MKKICFTLALAFLIFSAFPISARAYGSDFEESLSERVGMDGIENEYLSDEEISGETSINVFEKSLSMIIDYINGNGSTLLASFGGILAVTVLSAVMASMKFGSEALESVCSFVSVLVLAGVSYSVFYRLIVFVTASLETLMLSVSTHAPIMAALYVFGGNTAVGAASSSALALFLSVMSAILTRVLLPLTRISFALCLAGALPTGINIAPISNLVKTVSTTVLAFIFTLLSFTLYFQTAVAAAGDNLLMRSVRFASGVFVPVIGGIFGDASRTVLASVGVLKSTVGVAGVVIILSVVLPPLVAVILNKLMLVAVSSVGKLLSCERESAFLDSLCGSLNILLALTVGSGAVSLIAMAVFIRSGVVS